MKRLIHCLLTLIFPFFGTSSIFAQSENLALNKTATQSSTYGLGQAYIAVDGDIDGTRGPWGQSPSIQHTQNEFQPWWEVDLGSSEKISSVKIYNRTDGFMNRLQDFYLLISEVPFSSEETLDDYLANPSIRKEFYKGSPGAEWETSLNTTGRYVRVQLRKQGILHVAEVEVIGVEDTVEPCSEAGILMELFEATQGSSWFGSTNWGEGCPCENDWLGIRCDEEGNVTQIFLEGLNLQGFIPGSIGGLKQLAFLDIGMNKITSIPSSIGELKNLKRLTVYSTELTEIPESIGEIQGLKVLVLNNNKLTDLPSSIGDILGLEALFIEFNSIDKLPSSFSNLTNLKELAFSILSEVPEYIGEFTQLERLGIIESGLLEVPAFVSNLVKLKVIFLNNNKLSSLPDFIGSYPELENIDLRNNDFSTPPENITGLEKLDFLDLRENSISCFPSSYELLCEDISSGGVSAIRRVILTDLPSIGGRNAFRSFCETGVYACEEEGCSGQENLALGKATAQSSTYGQGVSSIAVDGDTDGSRGPWGKSPSIQHTKDEFQPWWELDLEEELNVNSVLIYNRSNFQYRLNSSYVFLSSQPFEPDATVEDLLDNPNITSSVRLFGLGQDILEIPFDSEGRYVRIQLERQGILHMAEVEVLGCPIESSSSLRLASAQEDGVLALREAPSVYPNPTENSFTLEIPVSFGHSTQVKVLNALGQVIEERELGDSSHIKLGSKWPTGMYSIEIRSGQKIDILKLLKQ